MSARVYLMADFGKGPVVLPGRKSVPSYMPVRVVGQTGNQYSERARRWWLVEAESADAARECVRIASAWGPGIVRAALMPGRIVASGGKDGAA